MPKFSRNAQLSHKLVYWVNPLTKELRMGLPENFPAPYGWDKIVCTSALQAEWWSERLRQQDKIKAEVREADRMSIEEPIQKQLRMHMHNLIANAKNNINRDFLKRSLANMDKKPDPWKWKRESYLHSEAFEQGK